MNSKKKSQYAYTKYFSDGDFELTNSEKKRLSDNSNV